MHIRFLFALLSFLFFQSTPPAGDPPKNDPPKGDPPKGDPPAKVTFSQEQQDAINDMLARERKDAEEKTATRLKDEATRREQEEKDKRERDEAEKRGEFEKVRQDLEGKLKTAETDRESLQERLDTALKVISDTLAATWDGVPEEVRDLYDGADDDALAKQAFLSKPATQKLIEKLTEKPRTPGNGPNPPASDGTRDLKAAEAEARANPKYSF